MTTQQAVYRRVLRRETHSPRTVSAVMVASLLFIVLIAAITGAVWWLMDAGFRDQATAWISAQSENGGGWTTLTATGAISVLVSLLLLVLALSPGRRARRTRTTERMALLVDDGVLADAVADAVAVRGGISRRQVSVTVGRRVVTVRITPTSGLPLDRAEAEAAVTETLAEIGFAATPRLIVAPRGVVA